MRIYSFEIDVSDMSGIPRSLGLILRGIISIQLLMGLIRRSRERFNRSGK